MSKSIATLLVLCAASTARADDPQTSITIEEQNYRLHGSVSPDTNGTIVRPIWGGLGVYSFFYVDKTFAEAIAGPSWQPTAWLTLAFGAGVEQGDQTAMTGRWRAGGMLWLGNARWASTLYVEDGASGWWAREEFAWRPRAWIGLGALGDTSVGYGPRVELNLPRTPFQLWGATLISKDGHDAVPTLGFRLNL